MLLNTYSIVMKHLLIPILFLLANASFAQSSKNSYKTPPPLKGHYKKLAVISPAPQPGLEPVDTLRFVLIPSDTRIPLKPAAAPESKCDPAACQSEVIGNGRKRAPYYLTGKEDFFIQDPPANSSLQTRAELDYLLQLQSQRTEEDIRSSMYYAGVYYRTSATKTDPDYNNLRRNLFHIGRSIGTWFHPDSLPATAELVINVWKDAEFLIWKYKNYYQRIRPYKLEGSIKNLEETNWAAYPSGHASNSYVNAFLYSRLIPDFTNEFIKDAYDMAHSREIIGVHYPSDSESGRQLAWQLVNKLFENEAFRKDFAKAKEEIRLARLTKGF